MKLTTPTYTDWYGSSKMCRVRVHMESQIKRALYKQQPERDELLLDTDKPLIALYIALCGLHGQYTYFLVLKPGRKYAPISNYVLKS